jgi:membrane associated rhomboid family serine protease
MAAFGSPVAQRFGVSRFFILVIICTLAGAFLHYLTTSNPFIPIIGASGAVSGLMGAAARFAFQNMGRRRGFASNGPALTLVQSFQNRQFLMFFTIWMGMNYLFGSGYIDVTGEGSLIAWQAHIGGFLAGVLIFGLLDPNKNET